MAEKGKAAYFHRRKADGSHDSICLTCFATISSQGDEGSLAREEEDHVCKFSFLAKRIPPESRAD